MTTTRPRLPAATYVLSFSLFAMGTSEFLIAGVLPAMASELDVSLPSAGALISAFAVGVLVGAPPLALLTLQWPRRTTLVASQALFVASMAVGLLADAYWPLLAARIVSGIAYAGFWAVASAAAVAAAPPNRTARALSVVVAGLSVAMVAGGPAGTVLSELAGWQAGFWAVTVATTLSAVAVAVTVPKDEAGERSPDLRNELRPLRQPRLWMAYGTTALTTAMYMGTFGYLGALLTTVSGLEPGWVPVSLSLFGIGAFAGLTVGGRTADRHPSQTLLAGIAGAVATSVALAVAADNAPSAVVLVFLLGFFGFLVNPAVWARVYTLADGAPSFVGATNVSAFQLGIMVAPLAGGVVIGAGQGIAAVGWAGALFGVAALGTATLKVRRNASTRGEPAGSRPRRSRPAGRGRG